MSETSACLYVFHLDDEAHLLHFIPRMLCRRIAKSIDPDATLTEHDPDDVGTAAFEIVFRSSSLHRPTTLSYVFYGTGEELLKSIDVQRALASVRLIILDLRIGDDPFGQVVYDRLRSSHPEIPCVFLTAYPGQVMLNEADEHQLVFSKPPNRVDLVTRIFDSLKVSAETS